MMIKKMLLMTLLIICVSCNVRSSRSIDMDKIAKKEYVLSDEKNVMITLCFDSGKYYGNSGVNNYTGDYTVDDNGVLTLQSAACTMMAGPPDVMQVERTYLSDLQDISTIYVDEDEIILKTKSGKTLKYRPLVKN